MVPKSQYVTYFDEFEKLRLEHKFLPELMFNIDETMIDVLTKPEKVVIFKDEPSPTTTEQIGRASCRERV